MANSKRKTFGSSGPSFLTVVDWNNSHHRRSVAASLVKGVYMMERDRQKKGQGPYALDPLWWEFFNFKLHHHMVDPHDRSYFGVIYEFNLQYPYHHCSGQRPPQYVIAFRGTMKKVRNIIEDLKLDLSCITNDLEDTERFKKGYELAQELINKARPRNVWLAGHSLGSSISLLIGRKMVKEMKIHPETYLFNPPFISLPIERIKNNKIKLALRITKSVLTAGLVAALKGGQSSISQETDPFVMLSSWIPNLFLNPSDSICSEYEGYFEHREKMKSIGAGIIEKLATKHSMRSIFSSILGKDSEAVHLIPHAYLTINLSPSQSCKEAHGIDQWWRQDREFKDKLHQYEF